VAVPKKLLAAGLVAVNILVFLGCRQTAFWEQDKNYTVKLQAATKAAAAQQVIGPRLLGEEYTSLTTTLGAPAAKKLAAHPDFAAVAVDMLLRAGVRPGDTVALNMSGSFPALNIATIAAVDALGAKPVFTSSVGASTWGANRPDYTWLDMEQDLVRAGIWSWRSAGVSLGGGSDMGRGLQPEGITLARQAIVRSGSYFLDSRSLQDGIRKRLDLYKKANQGSLPAALINVGGSQVIFGDRGHEAFLQQGLTLGYRPSLAGNSGLAAAFIDARRPVLHFLNIQRLAAAYAIQEQQPLGSSKVFYQQSLPMAVRLLILGWLAFMVWVLYQGKRRGWWQWTN
jgi:poly-gamma-glutamate system protein